MNIKNGYYKVGEKIFTEKINAVLYASATNQEMNWFFNDDVYKNALWSLEPELGLDDYYKLRALQIREAYDYVIVLCSGGADSTNVAFTFLNNGIKIDEIIAAAPMGGIKQWQSNTIDKSAGNTMSETLLVQLPLMKEIHEKYPDTKITINDYWDNLLQYQTDDWIWRCGEWIHPTSAARYDMTNLPHIRALAEAGKKIGIVYGIDKPTLVVESNGDLVSRMTDLAVNVQRSPFDDKYTNVENVLFYWSCDMPLMQIKQAHVLAKWIHLPENSFAKSKMLDLRKPAVSLEANIIRNSFYQRAVVPGIYPSTHRDIFQGHKPTRMFLGEHDDWFYKLHAGTRTYEMIVSDFRNFIKSIHVKFLNANRTGFKLYVKKYKIGNINDYEKPEIVF